MNQEEIAKNIRDITIRLNTRLNAAGSDSETDAYQKELDSYIKLYELVIEEDKI